MLSVDAVGLKAVWITVGPGGGPRRGGAKNRGTWSVGGCLTGGKGWGTPTGSDQPWVMGMATQWAMMPLSGGTGSARMAIDTLPPYSSHGIGSFLDSKRILRRAQPAHAAVRIKADMIKVGIMGSRIGKGLGSSNDSTGWS